ncbi:MAG: DUF296 domain-containing protein [Firmicutes bacterium]|nr:DUF296 domain-containing protein [Bacillota bacterium]
MKTWSYRQGRFLLARLAHGSDLLESIEEAAHREGISVGVVQAIGAVKGAVLAAYHQDEHRYETITLSGPLELAHCTGSLSTGTDGRTMAHLHVVFSDEKGRTFGGHLLKGAWVFAGEASILELEGPALQREKDEVTGLNLWRMEGC